MKRIFIIVLSFNGGKEIIECLKSVISSQPPATSNRAPATKKPATDHRPLITEVIVVDNGSTDGSLAEIEKLKLKTKNDSDSERIENSRQSRNNLKFKTFLNKTNLGFAAGNNVGIRYALKRGAEAVLLLNQDTIVGPGFLKPLLENPADIVAPVIKFKRKGKWIYDFGGKLNWWLGKPRHLEQPHLGGIMAFSASQRRKPATIRGDRNRIDYVSGCAMLIKRPVLEEIGLLDERFFLYFEDLDFCLQARKAGFKIAVEPKSVIVHKLAEKEKKPLKQHLRLLKSNFIFINRYLSWWKKPLASFYLLALLLKIIWNQWK